MLDSSNVKESSPTGRDASRRRRQETYCGGHQELDRKRIASTLHGRKEAFGHAYLVLKPMNEGQHREALSCIAFQELACATNTGVSLVCAMPHPSAERQYYSTHRPHPPEPTHNVMRKAKSTPNTTSLMSSSQCPQSLLNILSTSSPSGPNHSFLFPPFSSASPNSSTKST